MRAPLPYGAVGNGGPIAPGDRHGESIRGEHPRWRIVSALVASWLVAFQTLPAAAQSSLDSEVEDLLGTIRRSEDTISEQAAHDARLTESRVAIDALLTEADLASQGGDPAKAEADISRARSLLVPGDTVTLNRILLAEATMQLRAGNLDAARHLIEQAKSSAVLTEGQAGRIRTLEGRLADRTRDAAERADKERLRAELDALDAMPLDQAIAAARLINAQRPSEDIAVTLARLLVRDWQWDEAESIYLGAIGAGGPLSTHERAALGLVDLYIRTNRLDKANTLLAQIESETGSVAPDSRTAVLRERIDAALAPNRLTGTVSLKGGYESNVPGAISIDEDRQRQNRKKDHDGGSGVIGEALRARYARVVTPNDDQLFLQGGIEDFRYFNTSIERTSLDVSAGYLHLVPASTTEWEAWIGYKARFIDFDSYRRTLYGAFILDHDVSRTLGLSGTLLVEAIDDDDQARDGVAAAAGGEVDVMVTDNDEVSAGLRLRYEDAREETESRGEIGVRLAWRHDFTLAGGEGWFFAAAYAPTFVRYAAAKPGEPVREDLTHRLEASLGKALNEFWTAELTGTYTIRDSNIRDKDTESGRIMFTLSRDFEASWQ